MKLNKKDRINDLSIKKRQEFIQKKKVQMLGLIIVICCFSYSLSITKDTQLSSLLRGKQSVTQFDEGSQNLPENIEEDPLELEPDTKEELTLYALSACLMDASNGRVLYHKDGYHEMPMASTTKIMTLLVVLEHGNLDDVVTVTSNAAKQPAVRLGLRAGEKYVLRDLLYSLMLESHNDTAVAIAEHVGGSVEEFCNMMTAKAIELGADHTSFKTPNGLDEDGHYTTARDLSLIASFAIRNKEFCKIVRMQTYQFDELSRKRSFTVNNKDRFLYMMEGAIGIKTGFTGKAGYCFVGAIKINGKTFVSTVLGSGWPPHKEYKWSDTKKLMRYGLSNFETHNLFDHMKKEDIVPLPDAIRVYDGKLEKVKIQLGEDLSNEKMLLSESERVTSKLSINQYIEAPVKVATKVGEMNYYINHELYQSIPIITTEAVDEVDYGYYLRKLLEIW